MKNNRHAAIVGAGLVGRLLAWQLSQDGWQISLFDQNGPLAKQAAAYAAGGMLAPLAEAETHDKIIYELGLISLKYWQQMLPTLTKKVFFQQRGTIITAHSRDHLELERVGQRLQQRLTDAPFQALNSEAIQSLEPELINFQKGYFFPNEAQIDGRQLLEALSFELTQKYLVNWHYHTTVTTIKPYWISVLGDELRFDWVFDCRGIGARPDLPDLRGVRGELIYLSAPEVNLQHLVRLYHPRYPLYIIPRPKHIYLIGATEIEGEDCSPISVRSCLELLSAAYSVHSGFAEARIIETITATRPSFADNLPRLHYQPGLIRINGLYRHGFLIAPALIKEAVHLCCHQHPNPIYPLLIEGAR